MKNIIFEETNDSGATYCFLVKLGQNFLQQEIWHYFSFVCTNNFVLFYQVMQAPILIEKKHNKTSNAVSKKGPTREEVFSKVEAILDALLNKESTNEALEQWKEASFPNAMTQTAVNHLYKVMLEKGRQNLNLDLVLAFIAQLAKDGVVNNVNCTEAFIKMLNSNSNNNFEDLAVVAASAITEKIADFKEMAEHTKG